MLSDAVPVEPVRLLEVVFSFLRNQLLCRMNVEGPTLRNGALAISLDRHFSPPALRRY